MSQLWPMVALGETLTKSEELVEIQSDKTYRQVTVRLWGNGLALRGEVDGTQIATTKQTVIHPQQFVISRIDARNGASGIVPEFLDGAIVTNDFPVFNVDHSRLLPEFLGWMSRTQSFVELCKAASEGTTNRVRLKLGRFLATDIPLPPLDEQRRIVARIEALAAKVEQAQQLRQRSVGEVERLIGATASRLLTQNSRPKSVIEEMCEVRGGIQKSKDRIPDKNPRRYITVAHVQRNWIDIGDPRYFEVSDAELERWRLLSGDILVVEGNGSAEQIGRTALFEGEIEDCVHQNHVIRVRPDPKKILPKYLNVYLNSPGGQEQMRERSRTTSGLFNLSVARIKTIEVPVPALSEQRRIVAYLDNLQVKVEAVKRHQAATTGRLESLLPSILDRAFRGEL